MIEITCDQGSDIWKQTRAGIPSASRFSEIVTVKGEPSKSAEKYMEELIAERLTGKPIPHYQSKAMINGNLCEPQARTLYELIHEVEVRQVGFCFFDEQKKFGSSPDGLIGEDGGLEIKTAEPHIQIHRLRKGWSQAEHWQQVQGNLLCTGRKWWHVMSYCDGLDPLIIEVKRDNEFCARLLVELKKFCDELDLIENKLRGIK
jgi:hypothetical protein